MLYKPDLFVCSSNARCRTESGYTTKSPEQVKGLIDEDEPILTWVSRETKRPCRSSAGKLADFVLYNG